MSEIRVRLYGALNLDAEGKIDKGRLKNGVLININETTRVVDVLKQLKIMIKDAHIVCIGKERVMLDAVLKDGDTLHIYPMMGGG